MNQEELDKAKAFILDYLGGVLRRVEEQIEDQKNNEKQVRRLRVVRKFLKEEGQRVADMTIEE